MTHVHPNTNKAPARLSSRGAQCKTHTSGIQPVSYETLWVMLTGSTSSKFFHFFMLSELNPICFIPLNSFQDVWCIRSCELQSVPEAPVLIIWNKDKKKKVLTEASSPALRTATWGRRLVAKLQAAIIIYHNSQWTCQRAIFFLLLFFLQRADWTTMTPGFVRKEKQQEEIMSFHEN